MNINPKEVITILSEQNAALNVQIIALQLTVEALEGQLAVVPQDEEVPDTEA